MRPSYLARHANGRYYLQMRSRGIIARELSIRLIRASLWTSDSSVARQRLLRSLVSIMEVVGSNGLSELCDAVIARLQSFNNETSFTEDGLAERLAYETIVRSILDRLNAARFDHVAKRPQLIEEWMHFVEANAGIPRKLAEAGETAGFEKGRHATIQSVRHGWLDPHADHPAPPVSKPAHGRQEAATPRDKANRRIIAEIRNGAAIRAQASSFLAEPSINLEMSDRTDFGWDAIGEWPQTDRGAGPDTGNDISDHAEFGRDDTQFNVVTDNPDPQPTPPKPTPPLDDLNSRDTVATEHRSSATGTAPEIPLLPDDAYQRVIDARESRPIAPDSIAISLSFALTKFISDKRKEEGDGRSEADVAPTIRFMIDLIGDKTLNTITRGELNRVNEALPDIPTRKNVPRQHVVSLHARYEYARKQGWAGLERLTITTIQNRYHSGFRRFFKYLKYKEFWCGEIPSFNAITAENMTPLPRDKIQDQELITLASQPLFTGCRNDHQIWSQGPIFLQNYFYWGFLILILTGMRTGEVGNIDLDDIKTDGEYFYFDLRPFDAEQGRVPVGKMKKFKTSNSARVVPIHPLLINLGLLERAKELQAAGCTRLFPDCVPYVWKDGVVSLSRPLTRSFQYIKRRLGWTRANLQLYGTRHLMSGWLDGKNISGRTKRRILGHAPIGVGDTYGPKGFLDPAEAKIISEIEPPVVQEMRRILVGARERALAGNLKILKPWLELDFKKSG